MNKYRTYEDQYIIQREGIMDGNSGCIRGGWFDLENNSLYDHIIQPYENPINPDEPIFYYHSDHLGSASFLTDTNGIETQHLVYLPFGEDWVDMKYNTSQYDTPYKFNGKEKDEETGYNNYGARYYYDWASIWLSVDPMSDKGPGISSYAYCFNNPVRLSDPDGNWPWEASHIKAARKFAKANNAYLSISSQNGNKVANVVTGSGMSNTTLSHFFGKNDSWGNKISNAFSKAVNAIDRLIQNGKGSDGGNRGGLSLETNNPVSGIQGPAISTDATDIQSVNVDDLMNVLNVPSGNTGKMLNSALNMIDAFKSGSNAVEGIQNTMKENKKISNNNNNDTVLELYTKPDKNGFQIGGYQTVNKDSIKEFKAKHNYE